MNYEESSEAIRKKLAALSDTNAEDWHLCLKARFGMALVFEAIRDKLGAGEVITTPYTCITAINPILVAGLTLFITTSTSVFLAPANQTTIIVKARQKPSSCNIPSV